MLPDQSSDYLLGPPFGSEMPDKNKQKKTHTQKKKKQHPLGVLTTAQRA
jgi:hypothetical protein